MNPTRDLAAELSAHDAAAHALLDADRARVRRIAVEEAQLAACTVAGARLVGAVLEELQRLDLDGCYRVALRLPQIRVDHQVLLLHHPARQLPTFLADCASLEKIVRLVRAGNTKIDGSSALREATRVGLEAAGFTVRVVDGSSYDLDVEADR